MTTCPDTDSVIEWLDLLRKSAWTVAYILACMGTTVLCVLAYYAHSHGAVL